jgi:hypothetical protein
VPFLSKTFAQAAQIAENIESLEKRLSVLSREQLLTVPETEEERYDQLWSRY